jgi:hypothetical protein
VGGVRSRTAKRPSPIRGNAYGILNPYGDFWTWQTFETERAARDYVVAYWRTFPKPPHDTSRFRVIPVKVSVSAIADTSGENDLARDEPPLEGCE